MKRHFTLYVDESGDHSYGKKALKKLRITHKGKTISEVAIDFYPELKGSKRYLGLIGCIIEREKYKSTFNPDLEELRGKHFKHHDPLDDPVILHREDIINRRGPFVILKDPKRAKEFNQDLLSFLKNQEYKIIMVVIDKKSHVERYGEVAFHPYHYCLAVLLERFCGFLTFYGAQGDVLAESRGGEEDLQLKKCYINIYNGGTQFRRPNFFLSVLTSKEIKLKPKIANIAGLQLADILVHPLKQEILIEKSLISTQQNAYGREISEAVKNKFNCQVYDGRIYGYGKILL